MKKVQEDWKEEMLQVGVLTNTHGVRGEVKVYPTTDDVMRFKKLKQVFLDTGKEPMELQVTQARFFKNLVILKFKEFDNINDVLQTGANDIYVLHKDGEDDILLPAIKDCVKNVNIEEGTITVHLLNGLRDINKK